MQPGLALRCFLLVLAFVNHQLCYRRGTGSGIVSRPWGRGMCIFRRLSSLGLTKFPRHRYERSKICLRPPAQELTPLRELVQGLFMKYPG